jgi:hypothetical protein
MRVFIFIVSFIFLVSCNNDTGNGMNSQDKTKVEADSNADNNTNAGNINVNYKNKLLDAKQYYPFNRWRESYGNGLTQYTEINCNKAKKIFDDLISDLIAAGENISEEAKVQLFKKAILKTNILNDEIEGLIETGEREDLCELTDKITIACGMDNKKYGDGEGLASEWREW